MMGVSRPHEAKLERREEKARKRARKAVDKAIKDAEAAEPIMVNVGGYKTND